jgi:ankyrin repeat protein
VLTITAIFSNPDILQLLVNSGANINFQDPEMGWTALIWSAKEGHIQNTRVLLAAGADKTIQDRAGKTALSWATERKQSAIIDLLK